MSPRGKRSRHRAPEATNEQAILAVIRAGNATGMTDAEIQSALPAGTDAVVQRMEAYNSLIEKSLIQLMGDLTNRAAVLRFCSSSLSTCQNQDISPLVLNRVFNHRSIAEAITAPIFRTALKSVVVFSSSAIATLMMGIYSNSDGVVPVGVRIAGVRNRFGMDLPKR